MQGPSRALGGVQEASFANMFFCNIWNSADCVPSGPMEQYTMSLCPVPSYCAGTLLVCILLEQLMLMCGARVNRFAPFVRLAQLKTLTNPL
jgi:hypothetical protein